jgi:hypothetical protein
MLTGSWDGSVSIVTCYELGSQDLITGRGKILLFSTASRPAPGPNQPHIQWVLWTLLQWENSQCMKVTTHLQG